MHNRNLIKIPSKSFLMGEYSVLSEGWCLVHLHDPSFKVYSEQKKRKSYFHPQSPAGVLFNSLEDENKHDFTFEDPYRGSGGFGGSTAEVISVMKMSKKLKSLNPKDAFNLYMSLFKSKKVKPSGADFYGQYSCLNNTGSTLMFKGGSLESSEIMDWPFSGVKVLILKRNKKINTQNHLESFSFSDKALKELKQISKKAVDHFKSSNLEFFSMVDEFTETQHRFNLLLKETLKELNIIKSIDGVVSARGCGALGADVVAVFYKADFSKEKILEKIFEKEVNLLDIEVFK